MSIATELTRIATAKAAIKAAINAKGGSLTTETLDDYAAAISAIQTGGGGGGSASFYKCASVGSGTWTGYKAVWNSTAGKYEFESSLTSDTLTFTMVTPEVGKVYSADALIDASLWVGIPAAGLVFHASLNNGAIETGNTLTNQSGSISYTTVDGIPCGYCTDYASSVSGASSIPYNNSPRTFSLWFKTNTSLIGSGTCIIGSGTTGYGYFSFFVRTQGLFEWNAYEHDLGHGDYYIESISTVHNNVWHHLSATYDGTQVKIYVDGVHENSLTCTCSTKQNQFNIGLNEGWGRINGWVAGVRIYNRALSSAEIAALAGEFTPTA